MIHIIKGSRFDGYFEEVANWYCQCFDRRD